eukprot:gene26691-30163_t
MEDTGSLEDLLAKIAKLERNEFQLKMEVFYLHKKLADAHSVEENEDQSIASFNMDDRSIDFLALREDMEVSRQRIVELESEVLQLQLLRENEGLEFQRLLQMQPSADIAMLEESRRREREVARSVAEHDGALIAQLQSDLATLQTQHESDVTLVEDCTARLAAQMELNASKDAELAESRNMVMELTKKVAILTDTARQQEQILSDVSIHQAIQSNNEAVSVELESYKIENASLKEQLERQKAANMIQTEALTQLRTVATEMGKFENEEFTRLGAELSQCHSDRETAQLAVQRLEHEKNVLQKQLNELKGLHPSNEDQGVTSSTLTTSSTAATASPSAKQQDNSVTATLTEIARSRSPEIPTVDPRILDNYRKREADLLAALESLIVRCQELEFQAHEREDLQLALQQQLHQQTQHLQHLQAIQAAAPPRTLLDNSPHSSRRLRHSLSSSAN